METTNDILHFLNDVDFFEKIDDNLIEKLICVKLCLVIEFEDCNVTTSVYVLNIVDGKCISIKSNSMEDIEKKNSLRERILYLIYFTIFIENV